MELSWTLARATSPDHRLIAYPGEREGMPPSFRIGCFACLGAVRSVHGPMVRSTAFILPFLQIALTGPQGPADRAKCRPANERQPLDGVSGQKGGKEYLVLYRTTKGPFQLLRQRVR